MVAAVGRESAAATSTTCCAASDKPPTREATSSSRLGGTGSGSPAAPAPGVLGQVAGDLQREERVSAGGVGQPSQQRARQRPPEPVVDELVQPGERQRPRHDALNAILGQRTRQAQRQLHPSPGFAASSAARAGAAACEPRTRAPPRKRGRATARRRSRRPPAPARPARSGPRRTRSRSYGGRRRDLARRAGVPRRAPAPEWPVTRLGARRTRPSTRSARAAYECCASLSAGRACKTRKARASAWRTASSQTVVLPIPASPSTMSAACSVRRRSRNRSAVPNSASRPTIALPTAPPARRSDPTALRAEHQLRAWLADAMAGHS